MLPQLTISLTPVTPDSTAAARKLFTVAVLFMVPALFTAVGAAEEFTFGNRTLRVADGYEVEQVTDPTLVERPIAVARDERGRLYVTDSGGMTERAEEQLEKKPHRIRRLEDTDGDGKYDRSTLFADRMMFPEGCLWHDGSLYVAAPPEIWKLTDHDDDGIADQREVWFNGQTLTGCGNDLHGPYLGLDGRLYWCKGAFAQQTHQVAGGKTLVTGAAHIFRARPDGTELESVMTAGMDNPVNVAFLPNGERFLSCTFFQFPEAGRRDGMIHTIYGGVYGKRHGSIYAHQMTGDVMPVLNHQGAAAPCGMTTGSASLFGGGADQSLFTCYFNLHKVIRHDLTPDGATYTTSDTDLLACDHPDFHPTDVFEDADGSLLVVDTGGWYKVCCPTSQLAKPDVLGAVYRIRKKGITPIADGLGASIAWNTATPEILADLLADHRVFVQRRATAELRKLGNPAVAPLSRLVAGHASAAVRRSAVWTLSGIDSAEARAACRIALNDADTQTQHAAVLVSGLWRDAVALPDLTRLLSSANPGVARAAAESIGRIRHAQSVSALLDAAGRLPDGAPDNSGAPADAPLRIREHSLIYALIEIAHPTATRVGLTAPSSKVRRAALVALDQMDAGGLNPDQVIPLMNEADASLRATAVWIVRRHADWGKPLAAYFSERLMAAKSLNSEAADQLVELLGQLSAAPEIQDLLTQQLKSSTASESRQLALRAITQSGMTSAPTPWLDALATLLPAVPDQEFPLVVAAARNLPLPKEGHAALSAALVQAATRTEADRTTRLDALSAAGPGLKPEESLFTMLVTALAPDQPMNERAASATVLASASLSGEQRRMLLSSVRHLGPMELPKILPAFEQDASEPFGLELVKALETSDGLRGLRIDLVKPLLTKYPATVQDAGKSLLNLLNASAEQQAAHLDQLLKDKPAGDVRRGHEVFMSRKAACIGCHKLGYGGGRLGPDLTNIGRTRNERDLLEAVVYPSASIVRGYEPVVAELEDGRTVAGIVISETRDEVTIGIDAEKRSHLSRSDIAHIQPSPTSVMPNGIATLLTPQELADLLEFLRERK